MAEAKFNFSPLSGTRVYKVYEFYRRSIAVETTGLFSHSRSPPTRLDLLLESGWSFAQSVAYRCARLVTVISEKYTCLG